MTTLDVDACWRAVQIRDAMSDAAFVYAVRSTGVYCRPSCRSRQPRRNQVIFFRDAAQAELRGFRPCKRCRPGANGKMDPMVKRILQICRHIESHLESPLTLQALAELANLNPAHLQRTFKRIMGVSPKQYVDACRLEQVKSRLQQGQTVTKAIFEAGYSSSSRLYERANEYLGMTPQTYQRGGKGMRIGYTIVDCPLGRLLLAGTKKGISALYLGVVDQKLEKALKQEYAAAEIQREDRGLSKWAKEVIRRLKCGQPCQDLPLDVQATAFQWRVWLTLCKIPCGTTQTYGEIARALGQPTGARAVARACATNPVSVIIPCHRVVREDGGLGGYRWGLARKQELLEREKTTKRQS